MFWLAGILGLMAVGSLVVGTEEDDGADGAVASENDDMEPVDAPPDPAPDMLAAIDVAQTTDAPVAFDTTDTPLPAGQDQIVSGTESGETLTGGPGDDQINGYEGDDLVEGGAGQDILHGNDGEDTLRGGAGDDILHGEAENDTLLGDSGQDQLFGHDGDDLLSGGAGDDSAEGGQGNDTLLGNAGSDGLLGGYGDDVLDGGSGADTLFGGWGDDILNGREAEPGAQSQDFLNGGGGSDTIVAGAGDIVTTGDDADDVVLPAFPEGSDNLRAEVLDFDRDEDRLVVSVDLDTEPVIEITPAADQQDAVTLWVNGVEVALIHGGAGLTESDIALIDPADFTAFSLAAE